MPIYRRGVWVTQEWSIHTSRTLTLGIMDVRCASQVGAKRSRSTCQRRNARVVVRGGTATAREHSRRLECALAVKLGLASTPGNDITRA